MKGAVMCDGVYFIYWNKSNDGNICIKIEKFTKYKWETIKDDGQAL